jgi:cephalosporin-C deacetylase-like acetyl esterase
MGCKNRLRASKVCVRGYDEIALPVTHLKKSFLQLEDTGIYAINCTSAKETKICGDLIIPTSRRVQFPASIS